MSGAVLRCVREGMRMALRPVLVLVLALVAACTREAPASSGTAPPTGLASDATPAVITAPADATPVAAVTPTDAAPITPPAPARPRATPAAPRMDPMFACQGDGDCTLIWLGRGCVRSDPKAVAKARQGEAQQKFSRGPRLACGIGGPDYEKQVRAVERRYGVTCKAGQCTLVDRGEQRELVP